MKVLVTGAGGPAGIGVTRSLRVAGHEVVGTDCDKWTLHFSETSKKYLVPRADDPHYISALNDIIKAEEIEFLHAQPDPEVAVISEGRHVLKATTMLPSHEVVKICQDKMLTNTRLLGTGVPIPKTLNLIGGDLSDAGRILGNEFWVRDRHGAAGRGAWHVRPGGQHEAESWITSNNGWRDFIASEYLSGSCVTWQSVWCDGKLVCSQSRERIEWALANRSPSGVTGVTGVAKTISRPDVAEIGEACVRALDRRPNGIYGVDMKEDRRGTPRVTEVNIGRFFTTIEFFTQMGLNMPDLYVRAGTGQQWKEQEKLPDDWYWIRSMDAEPRLVMG